MPGANCRYWGASYGTTLVPPDNWPYKTWLAIIHTNDNEGPPKPEDVEKVLEKAHQLAPNARLRIGKMADFYNTIIQEKPELPVVKGDMPDTWIHGYMSMPREVKSSRNLHKDLFALEALNSVLNLQTSDYHDISKLVSGSVESSLLFDEHTFGMAMSHGQGGYWCYGDEFKTLRAQGIFKPLEDSWKEKADRAYQAERVATPTYNRQLRNLVKSVNVPGHRIVVYNSLAWERSGLVTIQAKTEWEKFRALKDVQTGELVDFTNERRKQGMSVRDALLDACPIRLRPILMTSIAIIAAAIPEAFSKGAGSETMVPMAVSVIGGVALSTILTLFVVPCAYEVFAKFEHAPKQ